MEEVDNERNNSEKLILTKEEKLNKRTLEKLLVDLSQGVFKIIKI